MKKLFVLAVICLLASASHVSAQLIIRNNGHAEIGHDPVLSILPGLNPGEIQNYIDTASVLKLYGNLDENASGARVSFGDNYPINRCNVIVGEFGNTDTDCLWLQGKNGTIMTLGNGGNDTIMYFDPNLSTDVNFRKNITTSGVFIQSDERFKENIEPVSDVLSSLENLEAVSYTLKNENASRCRAALNDMQIVTEKDQRDKDFFDQFYAKQEQGDERYGFLAQNVKEVFPQLVHTDNSGYMYVDYIGLIPILVQSINELKAELAAVKGEKQEEEATPSLMQAPQQAAQSEIEASLGAAKLYQNAPNPWSSETVIRYKLPQNVATACIYIYDMQGLQLKSIPAEGRGESRVVLTARDLKAGMYLYALVADGQLIDSKQMILTK